MGEQRYTVISADCHGGADIAGYRPYLEARWHDEFDAWAADYEIPYEDMTGPDGNRNWDSKRRLQELEDDGIVAEVIYPNTVPPFFPKVSFAAQPPPISAADAERRAAGLRAANRWLADFCADAPGRRAGIAQVPLTDIDASVKELHWAKENGLTGGLLLPGTPPGGDLTPLWHYDHYAPIWHTCEELGLPVNHHSGSAVPVFGDTDLDHIVFLLEVTWWAHRAFTHLIFSGTFQKHPDLQLVLTEQGTAWIPQELFRLDYFYDRMMNAVGSQEHVWGFPVVSGLDLKPSEYWARQCHVGSSFIRPEEVPLRGIVGVDKIMWGSDYPHKEASYPFSREAIRLSMADVDPSEIAMMLGGNAARVYGFDLELLDKVAADVGPAVEEIARPFTVGEIPVEADRCPAFVGHVGR
ncbi:MAG TPA: amidohydrolase family protein [Mycobacteriales bacterium]|nr:amidohydrolase family protein [Mycobacteriales bacterium]